MIFNAVLVVLAGCAALVTAQIPGSLSDLSSTLQQQAQNLQNVAQQVPQQVQGLGQQFATAPQQGLELAQNALGQLTGRLGEAYVTTYDNTRDNVYDTLETISQTGQKGVESGLKLVKNGVGLLFLLPQFGRNFLSNPHTRANQYPAQYNPQVQQYLPQGQGIPQARQYNPQGVL